MTLCWFFGTPCFGAYIYNQKNRTWFFLIFTGWWFQPSPEQYRTIRQCRSSQFGQKYFKPEKPWSVSYRFEIFAVPWIQWSHEKGEKYTVFYSHLVKYFLLVENAFPTMGEFILAITTRQYNSLHSIINHHSLTTFQLYLHPLMVEPLFHPIKSWSNRDIFRSHCSSVFSISEFTSSQVCPR